MLNVTMLSVVMLNVIMLSVVAPSNDLHKDVIGNIKHLLFCKTENLPYPIVIIWSAIMFYDSTE